MSQNPIPEITLKELYQSGKSMTEIAISVNCSRNTIVYWMNKYNIKRRSLSEAMYIKANPYGDPFSIKKKLDSQEIFLFGVGLGIYWGEGEKASRHSVRVANSDPQVILTFILFLEKICNVDKDKMRFSIVCFKDSDPLEVKTYWSRVLMVSEQKFGTIVQIPKQGKGIYKNKSKFGVCTITVSNVKLKLWIMNELEKLHNMPR